MSARNRPSDVGHCGGLGADDKGCGARLSRGGRQLFFRRQLRCLDRDLHRRGWIRSLRIVFAGPARVKYPPLEQPHRTG
ncbi:hypothetical protein C4K37_4923 [Pseudomonas chlororaphis subsp. piscium]|nr:hypothetical protein C4K37_4923 [Pseudomonas chlororaphis subsp. piscium]AZC45839.1 hypothetical protein C4K36_4936 [Pseudomonas chlororaphis subsp. piscium]